MLSSRLQLRSLAMVAFAYVASPLLTLTLGWLALDGLGLLQALAANDGPTTAQALSLWVTIVLLGTPICVVGELVLVTPLLLAFQKYRWSWLNGWTASLFGFAVCTIIGMIWQSIPGNLLPAGPLPRSVTGFLFVPVALGLFGAVGALVFRLLAVQRVASS